VKVGSSDLRMFAWSQHGHQTRPILLTAYDGPLYKCHITDLLTYLFTEPFV